MWCLLIIFFLQRAAKLVINVAMLQLAKTNNVSDDNVAGMVYSMVFIWYIVTIYVVQRPDLCYKSPRGNLISYSAITLWQCDIVLLWTYINTGLLQGVLLAFVRRPVDCIS